MGPRCWQGTWVAVVSNALPRGGFVAWSVCGALAQVVVTAIAITRDWEVEGILVVGGVGRAIERGGRGRLSIIRCIAGEEITEGGVWEKRVHICVCLASRSASERRLTENS